MPKPEQSRYLKSHEWAVVDGGVATVGISDHAQHEITDVVFVDLPKVGRKVKQGDACCVVESVKAAFDIYSPVTGEVAAVNEALVKDPAAVNRSAHEEGWLFKVRLADPKELSSLMDYKQYQDFIKSPDAAQHAH